MNIVLFEPDEIEAPLPRSDARARHILDVLRRSEGDSFDAGVINGPHGKATLSAVNERDLSLHFTPSAPLPEAPSTILIIGLPRPQTARDILRDATTLGATELHFVVTERADRNYATSSLWTSGEWRRHCVAGAAQAFDTRLPRVTWTQTLGDALRQVPRTCARHALDNYEATQPLRSSLQQASQRPAPLCLALGPERGWDKRDRELLRAENFTLSHLGDRVLRLETAVIAALAIARAG